MDTTVYHPLPNQWRIQDFPVVGDESQVGVILQILYRKLHEKEKIWTPCGASSPPFLGSANSHPPNYCNCKIKISSPCRLV